MKHSSKKANRAPAFSIFTLKVQFPKAWSCEIELEETATDQRLNLSR